MRILLVTNYQPPHLGGIECAAESLKKWWERDGLAVTWLTTDIPPGRRESAPDNVRIPANNWLERKWQINSPIPRVRSLPLVRRLIRSHDVVNVHSLAPGLGSLALWMAVRMRRPAVATQHVGIIPLRYRAFSIAQEKFLCRLARWSVGRGVPLTFVGKTVRQWFVEHAGLPEGRLPMTPAGIDHDTFAFVSEDERREMRRKWELGDDRFNVLYIGRFYRKKGIPILREVAARCPEVAFTFVGGGPEKESLLGLPNARVIKFVPTEELRGLYGAHDLFVMPSIGEGWPAVVPQAMACGLGCLISEETFQGYGEHAERFIVRPRDAARIVDTLRQAAAGALPVLRDRRALSDFALRTWDWQRTARIYANLFEQAIKDVSCLSD
jgi:glycosyltransferase involved in cell wall biosynthesis